MSRRDPEDRAALLPRLLRARQGDREMQAELLAEYEPLIVGAVFRYLGLVGCDLDDLKQYGRLAFLEAIERYDPQRGYEFRGWAHMLVRQRVRRWTRQECLTIRVPDHWRRGIPVRRVRRPERLADPAAESPAALADQRLLVTSIRRHLAKLKTRWQELLELSLLGWSNREIGRRSKLSETRVRQLLAATIGVLRLAMTQETTHDKN